MKGPVVISFYLLLYFSVFAAVPISFAQLEFIENRGQWAGDFQFKTDIPNGAFFLERNGFTVLQQKQEDMDKLQARMHGHVHGSDKDEFVPLSNDPITIHNHAYRVRMVGSNEKAIPIPDKPLEGYHNYFLGDDPSRWKGNCGLFQAVTYKDIYPNIDIRYYTDQGTLKYDFIVHPGGDPNQIVLRIEGADQLSIRNKDLIIGTSVGEIRELFPYTYQHTKTGRKEVTCRFDLDRKNRVRFNLDEYDSTATLVIDPTVIFCSFTGSSADNWGYTATYGPDGSMYIGGIVYNNGYPVSVGAFSTVFNGGTNEDLNGPYDIALMKLSANGRTRIWASFLGGRGNEQPHSLFCDPQGNLVMAGRSSSSNYPKTMPQQGPGGFYDIVVTKFNSAGSGLIGSVQMGGSGDDGVNIKPKFISLNLPGGVTDGAYETRRNYGDDARSEVILDAANNIYVASCTQSENFPTTPGAIQSTFGGGVIPQIQQDGVILKFSANLDAVLFSTFFGGTGSDACFVLSISPTTGLLYVGGATSSSNLPGDRTGVLGGSYQGGATDGFITQLAPDGSAIFKTTYAGTNGNDMLYGLQFDKAGNPYIAGTTTGSWPVINATYNDPGARQFIAKLKPDLSTFQYSTVFGTVTNVPNISLTAMLVDRCENVYVSGWGGGFNNRRGYPCAGTAGMRVTSDATQRNTDGKDFYFFVLEKNATRQLFGSFFGQNGGFDDHVDGGTSRFDANGIIYQGVCANCGNTSGVAFPTTPGVWAPRNRSTGCNQAAVKIEMYFAGVGASVKATINGVFDTIGCVPLTVRFIDTLAKGKRYIWDFGDGTRRDTTIAPNNSVSHTYTRIGVWRLMLISIDSTTCNISDTAYISVRVGNNPVNPNFTFVKTGGCESTTFLFTNTTTAGRPVYTGSSFLWDFGDGSPKLRTGFVPVTHTFPAPGTYDVRLTVDDSVFCNAPADTLKKVRIAVNVKAEIETSPIGCVPYRAEFTNASLGGLDFTWRFGDGVSVDDNRPVVTHLYPNLGTYRIWLIARDSTTCNKIDSTSFDITVHPNPTADFSFAPVPPLPNSPIFFTNNSSGATSYSWNFGDEETSTDVNPKHLFNETRQFDVCLTAISPAGCRDTICKPVEAKVNPLLDVPNAFTPGRFGENSVIRVTGYGIKHLDWRIYNRWGQLIYSTTDRHEGWDGTFKGKLQPMDVYTYTLDVIFSDDKKLRKTGDITLIR